MRVSVLIRFVALLAAATVPLLTSVARAGDDEKSDPEPSPSAACLVCHADQAKSGGKVVDGAVFDRSIHGGSDGCMRCHFNYESFPHTEDKETATCVDCHDAENEKLAESVHGKPPAEGSAIARAPVCADCHGVHNVFRATNRESKLYPFQVPRTCGACHFGHDGVAEESVEALLKERYTDDTHGQGLLLSGLVIAPTCVSCHGSHEILPPENEKAHVNRANVAETCGKCHVGVLEQYRKSIHGSIRNGGKREHPEWDQSPATCIDCHKPHHVVKPGEEFKRSVVNTCTGCHGARGDTYRGTFHGRMTDLGSDRVAKCADCHTAHNILPSDDPKSSVNPANRRATCQKCHPTANESFASYAIHADPNDPDAWPTLHIIESALTWMLHLTWMFGAAHMLLWLQRGLRDKTVFHREPPSLDGRWYERWRPTYRYLHLMVMIAFTTLALTGLPVLFHGDPWAQAVYDLLGGPGVARVIHRLAGALTLTYFIGYFIHLTRRMLQGEQGLFYGATSMVPRWKDVQDLAAHVRWFIRGGEQPQFDRWAYWHKFYFWAELWGVGVMAVTGLIMWFPTESSLLLSGGALNVADMVHSHEAILATSVIFVLHAFHMNLRPGKFPLDPVVFTGKISEATLRNEHPLEYQRMLADGRLESEALPPPTPEALRRAHRIGGFMLTMAFLLLVLMVGTLF